jgi:hypothetical protein
VALPITNLAVDHSDKLVTRPNSILTGFYLSLAFSTIHTPLHFFIDLSYHVMCFSLGFLPIFWHSLHIFSYSMIFSMSSFVLLSFCTC